MKTFFVLVLLCVRRVYSAYDCRRLNNCENGGTCQMDGTCACPVGYLGHTCRQIEGSICPEDPSPCLNGGTCFQAADTTAQCACPYGFIGGTCDIETVAIQCKGDSIVFDLNFPETFDGLVELQKATAIPAPCVFATTTANSIDTSSLTISLANPTDEAGGVCGVDEVTTTDVPTGTSYNGLVRLQYLSNMVTAVDEIVNVTCLHQDGGNELSIDFTDVSFDETNLPTDDTQTKYSPVKMDMVDSNNAVIPPAAALNVGDVFFLHVYLTDTTVFKNVLIEYVEANDTLEVNPKKFSMFSQGCPTKSGKKTIELQYAEDKTDDQGVSTPGKKIKLTAFKFLGMDKIGLLSGVKLCKEGDSSCDVPTPEACEAIINPPVETSNGGSENNAGATPTTPTNDPDQPTTQEPALRKRRAADDESSQTLSKVLTVRGPSDFSSSTNTGEMDGNTVKECLERTEIKSVLIILICVVCILFIACFILAFCLIRRKQQKKIQESACYRNERFQIPRAHVNEAYREM